MSLENIYTAVVSLNHKKIADLIQNALTSSAKMADTVVIGTVNGDMHDVGKNIVTMMLEGGGFNVVDIGEDQSKENFLKAVNGIHGREIACW